MVQSATKKHSYDQVAPVHAYKRSLDGPYVTDVFSNHQSIGGCDSIDKAVIVACLHRRRCCPQLTNEDIVSFHTTPDTHCIYNRRSKQADPIYSVLS